uniref:inorganic diphosphatase n=1 Tax=Prymnesium polylepis TaxID=72548 RepID=A0A7S4M1T4_9EUKA|mmetsp:Transcript_11199/g.27962  ORF Transcript_11199/g.27962 Transcript_11199/m.27962 type:complete len:315 (+) Transcript_11199:122-1066(+)
MAQKKNLLPTGKKKRSASPAAKRPPGSEEVEVTSTPGTPELLGASPTSNSSDFQLMAEQMEKLALTMMPSSPYGASDDGEAATFEFRRFLSSDGGRVSYWHDVPLHAPGGGFHAVIEIPRMTKSKMEICTSEACSPIKQDIKKGKLRDYNMPIKWNYGALPQTWEQPEHVWQGLEGHKGDNDPVDIVDLSPTPVECGTVIRFKPLAALAMIDEGEVDWKIVGINLADASAAEINSLAELEAKMPGEVDAVREWFTWYKAINPAGERIEGSEPNVFEFGGKPLDTEATLKIVTEGHSCWHALVSRRCQAGKLKLA